MEVRVEREFKACAKKIYENWTDPELISHWFGVPVKIEPRIGGRIAIDFSEAEGDTTGEFKELTPFEKIVFTWNSFNQGVATGETLVTVEIKELNENRSHMRLTHSGFKTQIARDEHSEGWNEYFDTWEKAVV